MLVDLAQEVCDKVVELDQRKKGASVNQDMQATDQALMWLTPRVDKLVGFLAVGKSRITGDSRQEVIRNLNNIKGFLTESRDEFKRQRRQVGRIQPIGSLVDSAFKSARSAWADTLKAEVEPLIEAAKLAANLLSYGQQREIFRTIDEITGFYSNPPQDFRAAAALAQLLAMLKKYAEEGLTKYGPAVYNFLHKVQDGAATVEDLDDDVYQWIKEQEFGYKFRINFQK